MGCKSFNAVAESPLLAACRPSLRVLPSFALTPVLDGCLRVAFGYLFSGLACLSDFFDCCSPHLCCSIWISEHCWPPICADATTGTNASASAEHMPQTNQRDSSFIGMPLALNTHDARGRVRVARAMRKAQVPDGRASMTHTSRLPTRSALASMKSRRGSTTSPINVAKI